MSTKAARKTSTRNFPADDRLPDQRMELLDRHRIAWKDEQSTWQGDRSSDVHLYACAPPHLQLTAVCDALAGPYLWIGIKGPGVEHGLCYGIIGGESLRQLASEVLRYAPRTTTREKPHRSAVHPAASDRLDGTVNRKRATRQPRRR